jgi:hypothetical protein
MTKTDQKTYACLISRILLLEVNLHISTDMALSSFMQRTSVLGFHFGLLSFQYVISPYPKGLQNYFQQPFSFMCHYSSILLVYTWQNSGIRFPTITNQAKWHSVHVWLRDRALFVTRSSKCGVWHMFMTKTTNCKEPNTVQKCLPYYSSKTHTLNAGMVDFILEM